MARSTQTSRSGEEEITHGLLIITTFLIKKQTPTGSTFVLAPGVQGRKPPKPPPRPEPPPRIPRRGGASIPLRAMMERVLLCAAHLTRPLPASERDEHPDVTQRDLAHLRRQPGARPAHQQETVRIFRDDSSVNASNQIKIQMCADETRPLVTKYGLDRVMGDGDPTAPRAGRHHRRPGHHRLAGQVRRAHGAARAGEVQGVVRQAAHGGPGATGTAASWRARAGGRPGRSSVKCAGAAVPTNLSKPPGRTLSSAAPGAGEPRRQDRALLSARVYSAWTSSASMAGRGHPG